jgi:hypothetical protein
MREAEYTRISWEMSAQRDIGLFFLFFSLDVKFVNTKKKKVLSTTVQILDVITSFNLNCYPVMMYRRKKIIK